MRLILFVFSLLFSFQIYAYDSAPLVKDLDVEFIRGNRFIFAADSSVYIDKNGKIVGSDIDYFRPEPVLWVLESGETMSLSCGKRPPSPMAPHGMFRAVRFYGNGEYKRGCSIINKVSFQQGADQIIPASGSNLDLSESGKLEYTQRIQEGLIEVNNQSIALEPGTEIYYFKTASVKFFTLEKSQTLVVKTDLYGDITLAQNTEKPISTSLYPNGSLARGLLGEDKTIHGVNFPKGTGLIMTKESHGLVSDEDNQNDSYLLTAIYAEPTTVMTEEGYSLKTKNPRFNKEGYIEAVLTTEDFIFANPENSQQTRLIPSGSEVYLDKNGKIVRISAKLPPELLEKMQEFLNTPPGQKI